MRLIDADELNAVIYTKFQKHYGKSVYQFIHDFYKFVVRQIVKAPTIEAEPVRHGRWKPTAEYDSCYCSRCLKQYTGFFASDWNYCPNCGAKMDKEE